MGNPYRVLGVSPLDSLDTIRRKYRRLSREYHPDNLKTGDARKFHEITEAWKEIERYSPKSTIKSASNTTIWGHKTLFTVKKRSVV